jgi:hypothetical protein
VLNRLTSVEECVGHLVSLPFDPQTVLKQRLTGCVRVGWSETLSLEKIKRIAHRFDATINDAIDGWRHRGTPPVPRQLWEDVDAFDLHAIVPVNLRTARSIEGMAVVLENEFGLVFSKLPIQGRDTARRLESLQETIGELK